MTDKELISGVIQLWMEATSKKDLDTVLSLMHDDVVFLVSGQPPMNKEQFAENFRGMMQQNVAIEGKSEVREIVVRDELAYCWSNLHVIVKGPDKDVTRDGPVLSIFKKTNEQWKLFRDANLLGPSRTS